MNRLVTAALRFVLIVLALGAVLAQVLVPIAAGQVADQYPEVAHLAAPYSVVAILAIVCAEVVLVIVWRLLSLIAKDAIFTSRALRWVDGIIAAFSVATALVAAIAVHLIGVEQTGGPAVALALMGAVPGGVALVLLMVVMRGLLRVAVADRGELEEVI